MEGREREREERERREKGGEIGRECMNADQNLLSYSNSFTIYNWFHLQFHQSTTLDDQEYYHIPHWINYSFYNPLQYWNRFQFRPQLKISDHLVCTCTCSLNECFFLKFHSRSFHSPFQINIHLNRGERRTKGTKLYNSYTGLNAY